MRCEDVIRELALYGRGGDAAIVQHLGSCTSCAEWSAQMAEWDRLWDLTRPDEPVPATWDAVWTRLESALDRQARPVEMADVSVLQPAPHGPLRIAPFTMAEGTVSSLRPIEIQTGSVTKHPWIVWVESHRKPLLAASAAAAILIWLCQPSRLPGQGDAGDLTRVTMPGGPIAPSLFRDVASVDIGEGEMVLIQSSDPVESDRARGVEVTKFEPDDGIDKWFVMFGAIESMANPVIAAR